MQHMPLKLDKVKLQVQDIADKHDLHATIGLILCMVNRRRIPLPSAVYQVFIKAEAEANSDLSTEEFLTQYIIPEAGKCFVDVGANVGGWTLVVAQKGNEVYSFEPSPKAYNILVERTKKYLNVHLYPCALGDKNTVGRLGVSGFSLTGFMDAEWRNLPGGSVMDIPVCKLDSLSVPDVGVIKIDTEGYEAPILQGAKETIQKYKPCLIIEVHKQTGRAEQTFDAELLRIKVILRSFGYTWDVHYRHLGSHDMQPFVIATALTKE